MKNRTLLAIICFALAAVLIFAVSPMITRVSSEKTTVVQLITTVPAGEMVTEQDIATVEIGKYGINANTIRNPAAVVGKYATTTLYPGTNLLPEMFTNDPLDSNTVLDTLDETHMAISITVPSFASMVSSKLERGDIVSVIASNNEAAYIPESLRYVKIITTTTKSGTDSDKTEKELASTITFLVTERQARDLVYLEQHAKVHLSLAARADSDYAEAFLTQQDEILDELMKKEEEEALKKAEEEKAAAEEEYTEAAETEG